MNRQIHKLKVYDGKNSRLPNVSVEVFATAADGQQCRIDHKKSDRNGVCHIIRHPEFSEYKTVVQSPGYWAKSFKGLRHKVPCLAIQFPDDGIGWWHRCVDIDQPNDKLGSGICVGVVDVGQAHHPALSHVEQLPPVRLDGAVANRSTEWHSAHVCGIIGARKGESPGYWGIAPAATLLAIDVGEDPHYWDVREAIQELAFRRNADLINICLGTAEEIPMVTEKITAALEKGCLCICAAGNYGDWSVQWPAKHQHAIAVTAIGQSKALGAPYGIPRKTLAAADIDVDDSFKSADYMLAKFSAYGEGVNCCAPGVGIVSTCPIELDDVHWWIEDSGTSMAAPVVSGVLAATLAADKEYRKLPRKRVRAEYARKRLEEICTATGLAEDLVGWGLPKWRV